MRTSAADANSGAALTRPKVFHLAIPLAAIEAFLIIAFMVLVVIRIPAIFTVGRFWAEEGVVYFSEAWSRPWFESILTIHTGYLNLAASFAALLAVHLARVEHAPLVTSAIALAIQTMPAILLATSRIPWLQRPLSLAVALAMLLIPFGAAEVWLNSITSQFHLAVCVGLILAFDTSISWVGVLRGVLLVVAPLAGPVSGTLTPLFLLRAVLERSRVRLLQALLLGVPTLMQAFIVYTHPEPSRTIGIGLPLLLAVCGIQNIVLPLTGPGGALAPHPGRVSSIPRRGHRPLPDRGRDPGPVCPGTGRVAQP